MDPHQAICHLKKSVGKFRRAETITKCYIMLIFTDAVVGWYTDAWEIIPTSK